LDRRELDDIKFIYSVFDSALYRNLNAEWLFFKKKPPCTISKRQYVNRKRTSGARSYMNIPKLHREQHLAGVKWTFVM
jgi:hypothetical protein